MAIGAVGPNGVLAVKLAMMAQNGASEDATTQSLSMVDGNALEVLPKRKCALLRGVSLVCVACCISPATNVSVSKVLNSLNLLVLKFKMQQVSPPFRVS